MPYQTVSPELVTSLVTSTTVTREELSVIRNPHNPHRFSGVYSHRHGNNPGDKPRHLIYSYRARVYKFFELGSAFPTKEDAARAVVAWYKSYYGERWRHIFRNRKAIPWRLRRVQRATASGYVVDVYLRGTPTRVTHADVTGRAPGASERDLFGTPEEAKAAARTAMAKWFEREKRSLPIPATGLLFWRT